MLTAYGRGSVYLAGLGGTSDALQTALDRAASGEASPPAQNFLLLCYHYISTIGRYSGLIRHGLQLAVGVTLLAIMLLVGRAFWRERRTAAR